MNRRLYQEDLKLLACVTMLLDHVGAVIVYALYLAAARSGADNAGTLLSLYETLRIVGRLAFPVYCFLLAEGAHYTRSPGEYALRLAIGAVLAELPYDLAFYGSWTLEHQSVMITLLLGFGALEAADRCPKLWQKLLICLPFALAADWLNTDYGAKGVMLIAMFALTRELPKRELWQALGIWFVFSPNHLMVLNWIGGFSWTIQEWAILAMVPISLYCSRKRGWGKGPQWAFYLFYPVHLLVLYLIGRIL